MTSSTSSALLLSLSAATSFSGALVQLVIYVAAGWLLFAGGLNFDLVATTLVIIVSLFITAAIGIVAAALQISIQKGSAVLWALGSTSWLLAGTLSPVTVLPGPVRVISIFLPFTHSLTAMRLALAQSANSSILRAEIGILILFAVALLPLSIVFFSWTVRRARQLGTLSLY